MGLTYKYEKEASLKTLELTCFSNSDWAGDLDKRRSTTAFVILGASAAISWSNKKLQTVCLFSVEAEYSACTEAAKDVVCQRQFAAGLELGYSAPTRIYSDSQSAIALTQNPLFHFRMKHVEIRYHYVRQLVEWRYPVALCPHGRESC